MVTGERAQWLDRGFTNGKIRGSNPNSASRVLLSRLELSGSIPALVFSSDGITANYRKGLNHNFGCLQRNTSENCTHKSVSLMIENTVIVTFENVQHHEHRARRLPSSDGFRTHC
ncbi:hypothetical protein CSKR_101652 [Clonorchis sinensis]|uniref:Uncharacterized protein n=1 Tax=Clonorchis sinensis TaxID=79923 RepID=A0A419Q6W2_CLOSI|nr:hypothetical protein CSKR_101652 [Clonorchis sinensis]